MTNEDRAITSRIYTLRGVQVILDRDLAAFYGVEPRVLNQAVKRNPARFPERFMHQLTKKEYEDLKSQIVISSPGDGASSANLKSQSVISSWGGNRYLPKVFTEQGVSMLSAVLRSPTAVDVSVRIMDAFVAMRRALVTMAPLLSRIEATERRQLKQEDAQQRNEERFEQIFNAMRDKKFPPQKVFFDGEFFDAFVQIKKFMAGMTGVMMPRSMLRFPFAGRLGGWKKDSLRMTSTLLIMNNALFTIVASNGLRW